MKSEINLLISRNIHQSRFFYRAWFYCKACHEDIRDETLIKKCKCKNCKYALFSAIDSFSSLSVHVKILSVSDSCTLSRNAWFYQAFQVTVLLLEVYRFLGSGFCTELFFKYPLLKFCFTLQVCWKNLIGLVFCINPFNPDCVMKVLMVSFFCMWESFH